MPTPCAHGITHDAGLREVRRVLRPGGTVHLMLYHRRSLTGYLLWARYGLLAGRPGRSLAEIYAHCLESPGTQAFSREDVRRMVSGFSRVRMRLELSSGDLVRGAAVNGMEEVAGGSPDAVAPVACEAGFLRALPVPAG